MILYTPLSESDIFPEEESSPSREFVNYQGRMVQVQKTEDGSYELLQLLSTDPHDYLNEEFSPGNILP